ncbi:C40 family peptidase [Xanthomonas campestris pv. raphani]|uniref:C40 family peptidase n=1 Tax=Xanthomonas TaxID=338 RepID=UPI001E38ABA2|nr:C40 family peptidase [Xanthomonas campestris]MCC5043063.1 C40 family peptidase [Xanthomonas campestris]MEA9653785.1 C40 family peptidase [Xanthomonas campestris pv. raphani]MEA9754075.1 C40 family peptidase [Xanthomonas campestris pv. raphani]MEA9896222.1 C40 family peptidase [Xanthomonas campestris pv. raphani]MEA9913094.1 C40 family peptidase [Xanthomonas campestris pv. raphani]
MATFVTAHYPGSMPITPVAAVRPRTAAACLMLGLSLLAACSQAPVRRPAPAPATARVWPQVPPANPAAANNILMRALGLVGTPYRYGGNTPESGFDCSGLVTYVYKDVLALSLPRTSHDLAAVQGPKIPAEKLSTGDLVFFGSSGSVSHVGIYVGEGRFVHAPSSGGTVRLDFLDGAYWRDHYSGSKRVLH